MDNLEDVTLFLIDQASKTAKRYTQRSLDEQKLGITVDQWVLLKIIEENDGLSQKELANKAIRDRASITRTLDLLEKKGFMKRQAVEGNRRQYSIALTKVGKKFIQENMEMIQQHRTKSIAGFSTAELNSLKEMLLRIQANMQ